MRSVSNVVRAASISARFSRPFHHRPDRRDDRTTDWVSSYSTFGGIVANVLRSTKPSRCNPRKVSVNMR
ncbi:hypothetical protein A1351_22190 [Methylosinus sp. R-45379]|nr:hypothetical protein A1351_22190 [Methylosinus sp. R-45379]